MHWSYDSMVMQCGIDSFRNLGYHCNLHIADTEMSCETDSSSEFLFIAACRSLN